MIAWFKAWRKRRRVTEYEIPPFQVHEGWLPFWRGEEKP